MGGRVSANAYVQASVALVVCVGEKLEIKVPGPYRAVAAHAASPSWENDIRTSINEWKEASQAIRVDQDR